MLKRFIVLLVILFSIQWPAFAESDRWAPISWYGQPAHVFVDNKSIHYDPASKILTFWGKNVSSKSTTQESGIHKNDAENNDGEHPKVEIFGDTVLSKYKIKLDKLDFYMERSVYYLDGRMTHDLDTTEPLEPKKKYDELSTLEKFYGNYSRIKNDGYFLRYSIDTLYEHEAKYACDYLGIPTMLKNSPHNWKFIYAHHINVPTKSKDIRRKTFIIDNYVYYICTDLHVPNYENGIGKFYIKSEEWLNRDRSHKFLNYKFAYVDFKKRRVCFSYGPYDARLDNSKEIIPDSLGEAVYYEALNILGKKK